MAGGKKQQRREKRAEKKASKAQAQDKADGKSESKAVQLPAEEFYEKADATFNEIPEMGRAMDEMLRNMIRGTVPSWTARFGAIPSLRHKTLVWLQLLLADEQKTAQLKLYALGSRVALNDDDSEVLKGSRTLFKDAAPFFMEDYGLWIFSRSLVRKEYSGLIDDDALGFALHDPLDCLKDIPLHPSPDDPDTYIVKVSSEDLPSGTRCAEIFLFFAVDKDVPVDLQSRKSVMDFLDGLNSKDGTRKIHAFTVVAGSAVATKEKLSDFNGKHVSA